MQYGQFELDEVLDSSSSQQDVYEACASDAVQHFLQVRILLHRVYALGVALC